jgi:ribosomal protein S27AE
MKHYTYAHSSPEGKVFYVGKGVNDRAFSFSDRSHDWKRAVKQHNGVTIQILAEWDTEEEAFAHERFLVSCFQDMQISLVNLTGGGKGPYGVKQSEEANKIRSQKIKGFVHKKITCPKCGAVGGQTSMKRWHFEKCAGLKLFRARAYIDGKRIHLGKFATQEEADQRVIAFYAAANKPLPKEFMRQREKKL